MNFIEEQAKREVGSIKKLWRGFLWLCVIVWAIYAVVIAYSSLMSGDMGISLLSIIFVAAAGYVGYRLYTKK